MTNITFSSDDIRIEVADSIRDRFSVVGIVEKCPIPDILNLLTLQKKTGVLVVKYRNIEKKIYLRKGEIVFASSSLEEDRLGESLVRSGKITKKQLEEASIEVRAGKKLGRVLVERGWITPKELFEGVRKQVQEIVFSLFTLTEGIFYFLEGEFTHENIIRFNMSTQMLIMEGIKMADEVNVYQKLYPDSAFVYPTGVQIEIPREEKALLNSIGRGKTVGELKVMTGLAEYELLKTIHALKEKGLIETAERKEETLSSVEEIIQNINSILMDIFSIIKIREPNFDYLSFFNDFFENMDPLARELFKDIKLGENGGIDVNKLLKNLKESKIPDKEKIVTETLRELLRFELFELKLYLSKKENEELQKILETTGML